MTAANQTNAAARHDQRVTSCSSARAARFLIAAMVGALLAGCNTAADPNHPLRGAASTVGWATTTGEPKDFVKARRSGVDMAYVPVGRGGAVRPVQVRNPDAVRGLERELDQQRDGSENFARRSLPRGAYNAPLPSVSAPPRPGSARTGLPQQPTAGAPDSYPVNPNRLRQMRDNARQTTE